MSKKHHRRRQGQRRRHPSVALDRPDAGQRLEDLARQYPEDREELLIEAAGEWDASGDPDRALAIYDRLLTKGCDNPHLIEAFRISVLWDADREADAREAAEHLRATHPHSAETWHHVAETFEAAGDLPTAAEWFTAGITHALGATPYAEAVRRAGADAEDLFTGRHRVRRLLGARHDDWDAIADTLHADHSPVPLDEASLRDLPTTAPDGLRARCTRGIPHPVPYWPEPEFTQLTSRYRDFAALRSGGHAAHRETVELRLRALAAEGAPLLAVTPCTISGMTRYARDQGHPEITESVVDAYAAHAESTPWPPHRNDPCWCGSGLKYKRCCGGLTAA